MRQRTQRGASGGETILIIEDDRALREGLALNFQLRGYQTLIAADGEEGLRLALRVPRPQLIVLDIMLPGLSGLDILGELRRADEQLLVLILSARDRSEHKIEGLETGADDYVTKPFDLPELLARAEAMLRRQRIRQRDQPRLDLGRIVIDQAARRVFVEGREVFLSAKEFDLLCLLARSPGRPFTRETILDQVWGWDFSGSARTVNNFILSLRQKLEQDPANPRHILTVRQVGYKLEP